MAECSFEKVQLCTQVKCYVKTAVFKSLQLDSAKDHEHLLTNTLQ